MMIVTAIETCWWRDNKLWTRLKYVYLLVFLCEVKKKIKYFTDFEDLFFFIGTCHTKQRDLKTTTMQKNIKHLISSALTEWILRIILITSVNPASNSWNNLRLH